LNPGGWGLNILTEFPGNFFKENPSLELGGNLPGGKYFNNKHPLWGSFTPPVKNGGD